MCYPFCIGNYIVIYIYNKRASKMLDIKEKVNKNIRQQV